MSPYDADATFRLWAIDPQCNAMLRTTCLVRMTAGDAEACPILNALIAEDAE